MSLPHNDKSISKLEKWDEEVLPHHGYIDIYSHVEWKNAFVSCYQSECTVTSKRENPFINVLIDFLTIIKYRKNDINNILRS
jgi:hypothetical protein